MKILNDEDRNIRNVRPERIQPHARAVLEKIKHFLWILGSLISDPLEYKYNEGMR